MLLLPCTHPISCRLRCRFELEVQKMWSVCPPTNIRPLRNALSNFFVQHQATDSLSLCEMEKKTWKLRISAECVAGNALNKIGCSSTMKLATAMLKRWQEANSENSTRNWYLAINFIWKVRFIQRKTLIRLNFHNWSLFVKKYSEKHKSISGKFIKNKFWLIN